MTKKAPLAVAAAFGNRILGYGSKPASQFLANEANWRIHPQVQQDVLGGVLSEVGFVQAVILNKRSDPSWGRDRNVETMVDGHARVHLALSRGDETEVPWVLVDLNPDEERLVLASFDPIGAMAGTDREKLDALVAELPSELQELTAVLRADRKAAKQHVEFDVEVRWRVVVDCQDAVAQAALVARLQAEGFTCRAD